MLIPFLITHDCHLSVGVPNSPLCFINHHHRNQSTSFHWGSYSRSPSHIISATREGEGRGECRDRGHCDQRKREEERQNTKEQTRKKKKTNEAKQRSGVRHQSIKAVDSMPQMHFQAREDYTASLCKHPTPDILSIVGLCGHDSHCQLV